MHLSTTSTSDQNIEKLLDMLNFTNTNCLYGLIDAAQYPSFNPKKIPPIKSSKLISLLGEAAQENAIYAGPLLLEQLQQDDFRAMKWLVAELSHRPFASIIVSSQPIETLTSHLCWLIDVVHEDGTEWVMRYYDPRILPHWLAVLTPKQKSFALRGIHQWIYFDVRGQWQVIEGEDKEILDTPKQPMCLSIRQHEQLMQKCMPHMLMNMLHEDDPSLLESIPLYQRYDYLTEQSLKACGHQLESMMDIKTYCMLTLMFGVNIDSDPEMKLALKQPLQQSEFSQRVLAWTSAQWDTISVKKS